LYVLGGGDLSCICGKAFGTTAVCVEENCALDMTETTEAVKKLEAWIREGGGCISGAVSIRCSSGSGSPDAAETCERGAFAGPDGLPGGEEVCRLPQQLLLTESYARATLPFGEALSEAAGQFHAQNAGLLMLAAKLLWDSAPQAAGAACARSDAIGGGASAATHSSGSSSAVPAFWPYYQALSADLGNLPSLWPPEHQLHRLLRGTRLEKMVKAKRHSLGLEFALLQSCAPDLTATWEEYLWARGTVSSRAYALQIDGRSERCLIPWADLLNHGGRGSTSVHYAFSSAGEAGDGCFVMRSNDGGSPAHREVLQSYGPNKSNTTLLLEYGFVLSSEPEEGSAGRAGEAEVALLVRLPPKGAAGAAGSIDEGDAAAAAVRLRLWRSACRPPTGASVDVRRSDSGPLFSLLRVATAGPAEAEVLEKSGASDANSVREPMSAASERKVLQHLLGLASAAIARLEEALPHGGAQAQSDLFEQPWEAMAAKACVSVAEEEKAVLRFYRSLAEVALSCLEGSSADDWLATLTAGERTHASSYIDAIVRCTAAQAGES